MNSDNAANQNAVSGILNSLIDNVKELFNTQINIEIPTSDREAAKSEILSISSYVIMGIISLTITATTLVFFGFAMLFFLSIFMPLWISALIVAIVYSFVGLVLFMSFKIYFEGLKEQFLKSNPIK